MSSEGLSTAAASFQEDGRSGRHDPEWIRQSMEAHSRRQAGDFDAYEEQKFQENWAEANPELSDTDDEDRSDEDCVNDAPQNMHHYCHDRDRRDDNDDDGGHASCAFGTGFRENADLNTPANTSNSGMGSTQQDSSLPPDQNNTSDTVVNGDDLPLPPRCQLVEVTSEMKLEHLFKGFVVGGEPILKIGDVFRAKIDGIIKDAKVILVPLYSRTT